MRELMRIALIMLVAATWVILSHREPFRSSIWLLTVCAVVSTGVLGGILGLAAKRHATPTSQDDRMTALQQAKSRYPRALVTLLILMTWLIFLANQTFGSLQSHLGLIVLGIGVSVAVWAVVPALMRRR